MKKRISACIALVMVLVLVAGTFAYASFAEDKNIIASEENILPVDDMYAATETNFDTLMVFDVSSITDSGYNGYEVYTAEEAAEYCLSLIKEHKTSSDKTFLVAVPYSVSDVGSPYAYAYDVYNAEFEKAFNDSLFDGGNGGDYLLYSMYGRPFYVTSSCKCFTDGDEGIALVYAMPGNATYYTTQAEEEAFKAKAAEVTAQISGSDYEKVCAIFDYICENVSYDYDTLSDSSYFKKYTAYSALCDGSAVCQGYANLFYYLCNEVGVPCRIVAGNAYNGSTSGAHAWNIVKLDGTWYHVDVTWGASYSHWYNGRYFFLQSEANFKNGHAGTSHITDRMTGIVNIDYNGTGFRSEYPISAEADYHEHKYRLVASEPASCGKKGYEIYQCGCGETYEETFPALTHNYIEIEKTEPTCTVPGSVVLQCENCKDTVTEPIAATGHSYVAVNESAATCVDYGYTDYVCEICGHEHEGDIVASAGGHKYEAVKYVPMTHEEDGYIEYKCSVCGDIFDEVIPSEPECSWEDPVIIHSSDTCYDDILYTCSICGKTEIEESHLHNFVKVEAEKATCTEDGNEAYEICTYCGRIKGDETGEMTPEDFVIKAEGHIGTVLDEPEQEGCMICDICGELFHKEGEDVTEEVSCTEEGWKTYKCAECGMNVTETIPALGHDWNEKVTKEATELTCAEITYTCKRCGETMVTGGEEHEMENIEALEATCLEEGYSEGTRCALCGMVDGIEKIEPVGHTEGEPEYVAATCTENGDTGNVYCSVCGEFLHEGEVIPASGHDVVCEQGYPATCTEEGLSDKYYCDICGFVEEDAEVLPMSDHVIVNEITEATCTEDGYETGDYCMVCGETFTAPCVIPATGHVWEVLLEAKDATCETDGNKALVVCAKCGAVDSDGEIIPAGHVLTHIEYKAPTEYEDGNIEFWYCYYCDSCFLDKMIPIAFEDTVLIYEDGTTETTGSETTGSETTGTETTGTETTKTTGSGVTGTIIDEPEGESSSGESSGGGSSKSGTGVNGTTEVTVASTGDSHFTFMWFFIASASAVIILIAAFAKNKNAE